MSIEYFAKIDDVLVSKVLDSIVDSVKSESKFEIIDANQHRVYIRFTKIPLREKWTEDIELCSEKEGIYIAIHSAEKKDRIDFIQFVDNILYKLNIESTFEED